MSTTGGAQRGVEPALSERNLLRWREVDAGRPERTTQGAVVVQGRGEARDGSNRPAESRDTAIGAIGGLT